MRCFYACLLFFYFGWHVASCFFLTKLQIWTKQARGAMRTCECASVSQTLSQCVFVRLFFLYGACRVLRQRECNFSYAAGRRVSCVYLGSLFGGCTFVRVVRGVVRGVSSCAYPITVFTRPCHFPYCLNMRVVVCFHFPITPKCKSVLTAQYTSSK